MKLKNYCLVESSGFLWSTDAMAGTVNINVVDVDVLVENFIRVCPIFACAIVVKDLSFQS